MLVAARLDEHDDRATELAQEFRRQPEALGPVTAGLGHPLQVEQGKSLLPPQPFLVLGKQIEKRDQDFPFRDPIAEAVTQDRRQRRGATGIVETLPHQPLVAQVLQRPQRHVDPGVGPDPEGRRLA